jgi:hypothetical protein
MNIYQMKINILTQIPNYKQIELTSKILVHGNKKMLSNYPFFTDNKPFPKKLKKMKYDEIIFFFFNKQNFTTIMKNVNVVKKTIKNYDKYKIPNLKNNTRKKKVDTISELSPVQIKQNLKNKVPSDVLESYLKLKKVQLKVPVPPPDLVLSKPEEFKKIVHTMVQSFGMFNGTNNPIVNYYRLLAKHLDLPTTFIPPKPTNDKPNEQTNDFIEMLRKQRNNNIKDTVDDEMKEIYKSLGINMEENKTPDDEMKEIYKSLGVNMEEKKEVIVDDEMKEIYKSLGIKIENEVKQPVVVDDEWLKL